MALSAAAAILLQQARNAIPPVEFPDDQVAALNIVAEALSHLLTLYAFDGSVHIPVALDPSLGRFINGGTAFRSHDRRGATLTSLWVRRVDLGRALLLIRQVGLPFALAVYLRRRHAPGA